MHICLITQAHPSLNPRLVKEADALSEAGHEVCVIAPDFSPWAREADRAFRDRPWRIVASPRFGPGSPPLLRLRELVRRHSARFLVARFGVTCPPVIRAALHPATPDLVAAALRIKADHYVAHYVAALPAAAIAARAHGASFAFDAEDFHLGDLPEEPQYETQRRMTRAIEGAYLPQCAYVTAASPGIAEAYVEAYGIARPTVILNVFPRAQAPPGPTPRGVAPGPSIYWFSQTIGPDRGIESVLRASAKARARPHLSLRGTPASGYRERLESLAQGLKIADRLHFLAPAPPSEMETLAAAFDVGWVGETGHTQSRRIALTNKLFSYLLAGIPVVASSIPAHVAFAEDAKGAMRLYPVDDEDALAAALDAVFGDAEGLARARAIAYRLGQTRFNWDLEKHVLTDLLAASLPARRAAPAPLQAHFRIAPSAPRIR